MATRKRLQRYPQHRTTALGTSTREGDNQRRRERYHATRHGCHLCFTPETWDILHRLKWRLDLRTNSQAVNAALLFIEEHADLDAEPEPVKKIDTGYGFLTVDD